MEGNLGSRQNRKNGNWNREKFDCKCCDLRVKVVNYEILSDKVIGRSDELVKLWNVEQNKWTNVRPIGCNRVLNQRLYDPLSHFYCAA